LPISHRKLLELLHYNPDTGAFTWIKYRRGVLKNREAGYIKDQKYRVIRIDGHSYYAHRLAWFYMTSEWPENQIDHIDIDGLNNRWDNLQQVTNRVNNLNKQKGPKSGFHGAVQIGKRFRSQGKLNGKQLFFGTYDTPEEAHQVYLEKCHVK
jgi:hypothetical protein